MNHEQRAQASYNQHRSETDPEWSDLPEPDRLACLSATEDEEA